MQGMIIQRTIQIDGIPLHYSLERKNVKNLNLHVRRDGSVYVSANNAVPEEKIDEFLLSKGTFIRMKSPLWSSSWTWGKRSCRA